MDPTACFYAYIGAVDDGELDCAADAAECYNEWVAKGGFKAEDDDGATVIKCDHEQDRYLVDDYGVERWRMACRPSLAKICLDNGFDVIRL